jgi:hypothetical protein
MRFQFLIVCVAVAFSIGCSAEPPRVVDADSQTSDTTSSDVVAKSTTYDSPEAVFAAYQAAATEGDFVTATQCMTDETQTVVCGSIVLMAIDIGDQNEEARPVLREVFQRYGIDHDAKPSEDIKDPVSLMKWAAEPVVNKAECVGSLWNWFKASGRMKTIPLASGRLINLQIEGDKATAVVANGNVKKPLEFVKEKGSWRMQFPKEVMTGKASE